VTGRSERGRARARVSGAIGHAIGFAAWHSLVREQQLTADEAVALMATMVKAAAQGGRERTRIKPAARSTPTRSVPGQARPPTSSSPPPMGDR
jgi:hypothetical protein